MASTTGRSQRAPRASNQDPDTTQGQTAAGGQTSQPRQNRSRTAQTASTNLAALTTRPATVPDPILRLAIDYGTVNLSVAYSFKTTTASSGTRPQLIRFLDNEIDSPVKLYWSANKRQLLWGAEVEGLLKRHQIQQDEVIVFPKLALYKDGTLPEVQKVLLQLAKVDGVKTISQLISMHLKSVVKYSIAHLNQNPQVDQALDKPGIDVAALKREVHLSVPEAWDPSSNEKMREAARLAQIGPFQLVSEPQCAAAFAAEEWKDWTLDCPPGTEQLVLDAGGGTVDLVKYGMPEGIGPTAHMHMIGAAEGKLLGSARINLEFVDEQIRKLEEDPSGEGLEDFLKMLNITEEALKTQLFTQFESAKRQFGILNEPEDYRVIVQGAEGSQRKKHTIDISKDNMRRYHDKVIDQIFSVVKDMISDTNTQYIALSGGFGRSKHFRDRIERDFPDQKVLYLPDYDSRPINPVAEGALLRHEKLVMKDIKMKYSYFVTQDEEYDPKRHPDVVSVDPLRRIPSTRDPNVWIVKDRIQPILLKDTIISQRDNHVPVWQDFYVAEDVSHLRVAIYWTSLPIKQSAALYDLNPRPHHPWRTINIPISGQLLRSLGYGFYTRQNSRGQNQYKIKARLKFRISGAVMDLGVQILRSGRVVDFKNAVAYKNTQLQSEYAHDIWEDTLSTGSSHAVGDCIWATSSG